MQSGLDAVEVKILGLMRRDASLSASEVSDRVDRSQSLCRRSIQRLLEES